MTKFPEHLADQTITIQRTTQTVGNAGEVINTWADIHADIAARVQPSAGSEPVIAGGLRGSQGYTIFVDASEYANITAADRIIFGSLTLKITGTPKRLQAGSGILRLDAMEVTP